MKVKTFFFLQEALLFVMYKQWLNARGADNFPPHFSAWNICVCDRERERFDFLWKNEAI